MPNENYAKYFTIAGVFEPCGEPRGTWYGCKGCKVGGEAVPLCKDFCHKMWYELSKNAFYYVLKLYIKLYSSACLFAAIRLRYRCGFARAHYILLP